MYILLTLLLFLNLGTSVQPQQIKISLNILPSLKENFNNEKISVYIRSSSFNLDTALSFPYELSLSSSIENDTLVILTHAYINIGEQELVKFFSEISVLVVNNGVGNYQTEIQFPNDCDFNKNFKNKICSQCKKSDQVIPIFYGLPSYSPDKNSLWNKIEHYAAGCEVSSCDATWYCKRDKNSF